MKDLASRVGSGPLVLLLVLCISLGATACGEEEGEEDIMDPPPPPPPVAACVTNNTATLIAQNQSASANNYVIVLNGANIAQLAPGDSVVTTVAAQVQHELRFNLDNQGTPACTAANPILAQCATSKFWCSE